MTNAREITAPLLDLIRNELASGRTNIARLSHTSGVSRGTIYATLAAPGEGGSLAVLSRLAEAIGATVTLVVEPGVGPAHAKRTRRARTMVTTAPVEVVGAADVALQTDAGPQNDPPSPAPANAGPTTSEALPDDAVLYTEDMPAPGEAEQHSEVPPKAASPRHPHPKKQKPYRPNVERWRSDGVMLQAWAKHPGNVLAIARSLRMNSWACQRRFLVMGLLEPQNATEAARIVQYRAMAQARCSGCSIRQVAKRTNVNQWVADQTLRMLSISGRRRTAPMRVEASFLAQTADTIAAIRPVIESIPSNSSPASTARPTPTAMVT